MLNTIKVTQPDTEIFTVPVMVRVYGPGNVSMRITTTDANSWLASGRSLRFHPYDN